MWIRFVWLRIGINDGLCEQSNDPSGFKGMQEIS
jgi:hypothetical protein